MKRVFLILGVVFSIPFLHAQEDSTSVVTEIEEIDESVKGSWDLNVDLASRYIWRGQAWGSNHPVVQLYGNYAITEKLSVGFWATSNFQKENFMPNDFGLEYDGYQEIDISASYQFSDLFGASLQWYYWPTMNPEEGVSNGVLDFGNTSVNTLDLMLMLDFSEKNVPLWFTWSTLVGGNDFKYKDEFDEKGSRNFTSYAEIGYDLELPKGFVLSPVVGAVFNNKGYYTYADEGFNFVNLGAKLTKEITLSDSFSMPLWISYTHNGSKKEFAVPEFSQEIKQDYIVAGLTLTLSK